MASVRSEPVATASAADNVPTQVSVLQAELVAFKDGPAKPSMAPRRLQLVMPGRAKTDLTSKQLTALPGIIDSGDVYVMTTNLNLLIDVFRKAESFSTALRGGQVSVAKILNNITPRPVFVFENKNEFTGALGTSWEALAKQVIVDRICIHKTTHYNPDKKLIAEKICCENHVRLQSVLTIPNPPKYWSQIAENHFDFFEKKKRYMVNTVHTALAILGYVHLWEKRIDQKDETRQVLSIILDGLLNNPERERIISVFLAGKAMQLLIEEPEEPAGRRPNGFPDDEEDAYEHLIAGGKAVIERMRAFPDQIGRVLQKEDTPDKKALSLMADRVDRHIRDLKTSINNCYIAYKTFPARRRPHVREITEAVDAILKAWGQLAAKH